jgi:hypothetical protein
MEWPIAYAPETSSGPLHDLEPLSEIAHSLYHAEVTFLQKPVAHLSLATRFAPTVQVGPGSISALLLSAPLSTCSGYCGHPAETSGVSNFNEAWHSTQATGAQCHWQAPILARLLAATGPSQPTIGGRAGGLVGDRIVPCHCAHLPALEIRPAFLRSSTGPDEAGRPARRPVGSS